MTTLNYSLDLLTWTEICERYPDAWVMVGYAESEKNKSLDGSVGTVLYADADKASFIDFSEQNLPAYKAKKQYNFYSPRFTGKSRFPKKFIIGTIHKPQND